MHGHPPALSRCRPFGAFRLALAVLVLLQHGLLLLPPGGRGPFYTMELGAVAVTVFFALSGFIVAEALATFYAGRAGAFLGNRVLRVVPPYLAALALAVALDTWLYAKGVLVPLDAPLHGSPLQPRILLAGLLEIVPGLTARRIGLQAFSFIPFAWTLRVEFAFYLAAFGVVWLGGPGPDRRRRVIAGALAAAYLLFAVFAWRMRHLPGQVGTLQVICVPFFAFGLCVFFRQRRPGPASVAHLLLVSGGVLLAFTYWGQRGHPSLAFQLPLLALFLAVLVRLAGAELAPGPWRRLDSRLGKLSYPLYVSHGLVLTALTSLSARRGLLPYVAAIPLCFILAALLHVAVEQPLRQLRTRLRGQPV